jgi:hypothetical protein
MTSKPTILPACGVVPVSIFRDVHVNYVMRRLGEATDEFFDALMIKLEEYMPDASKEQRTSKMALTLAKTVPTWGAPVVRQRVQRLMELARDFESAFRATFAVYVKDTFANDIQGKRNKVRICIPRLADFVHAYFSRISHSPEVKRGAYFDTNNTHARNFAVSNALLDALADVAVDNVRVENATADSARVDKGDREAEDEDLSSEDADLSDEEGDLSNEEGEPGQEAAPRRPTTQPPQPPNTAHRFHTFIPPVTQLASSKAASTHTLQTLQGQHNTHTTRPTHLQAPPHPPTQHPPTQHPPTQHPPTQHPPYPHPPTQHPPYPHPPTQHPPYPQLPRTQLPNPQLPNPHPPTQHPPTQHPPTPHPQTQPTRYFEATQRPPRPSSSSSRSRSSSRHKETDRRSALALISKLR